MNVQINHNSTNVTDETIEYQIEQHICTGIANCVFTMDDTGRSYSTWDTMVVYEGGNKKGTFYISEVDRSVKGSITLTTQDGSKKLTDYFISDTYLTEATTYAKYWIEKFLVEATVSSYEFTAAGEGAPQAEQSSFGLETAYDTIVRLLQQSGWFIYFDKNNKAIIGDISLDTDSYTKKFDSRDILDIKLHEDDQMLRNRAVVWGQGSTEGWVFADISKKTPWNYDLKDIRSVVLANGNIATYAEANRIALEMLQEFARKTTVTTVVLDDEQNVTLGNVAFIDYSGYKGAGMITSIQRSMNSRGLTTTLMLNERCPRLWAYYSYDQGYVYVATNGSGVWRKQLNSSTWESYNNGLSDYEIFDLYVANGILACVSYNGTAWVADIDTDLWTSIVPDAMLDENGASVNPGSLTAQGCAINKSNNEIYFLYNKLSSIAPRCWVATISNKSIIDTGIVTMGGVYSFNGYDLDTDDISVYLTVGNETSTGGFTGGTSPIDTFTTNNEYLNFSQLGGYVPSRENDNTKYDGSYSLKSFGLAWEFGKVSVLQARLVGASYDSFRIETLDFYGTGVDMDYTNSAWFNISAISNFSDTNKFYFHVASDNVIYIGSNNGTSIEVYSYNRISDSFTYEHTVAAYSSNSHSEIRQEEEIYFKYTWPAETSPDTFPGAFDLTFEWTDWVNNVSGSSSMPVSGYDRVTKLAASSAVAFDSVGVAFAFIGWNYENPWWIVYATDLKVFKYSRAGHSVSTTTHTMVPEAIGVEISISSGPDIAFGGSSFSNPTNFYLYWEISCSDSGPKSGFMNLANFSNTDNAGYLGELWTRDISTLDRTFYNKAGNNWWMYALGGFSGDSAIHDLSLNPITADGRGIYDTGPVGDYSYPYYIIPREDYETDEVVYILKIQSGYDYGGWNQVEIESYDVGNQAYDFWPIYEYDTASYPPLTGHQIIGFGYSQNVLAVRYENYPDDGATWYTFYQFGTLSFISQGNYYTIRKYPDEYKIIDSTSGPHRIEISRGDGPIVTFASSTAYDNLRVATIPSSGWAVPSGHDPNEIFGGTFGSWFESPSNHLDVIGDVRVYELGSDITTISGGVTASGLQNIFVATSGAALSIDAELEGDWQTVYITASGKNVGHVETSNMGIIPYMFIAISGVVSSGETHFLQRFPYSGSDFADYSAGAPSSEITCIRLDDRI